MDTSQIDYSQIIIETLNKLFSTLLSSIDNSVYSLLDKTVFINNSFLNDKLFEHTLNSNYGLTTIANALLIGFVIYYCFRLMMSQYIGNQIEKPYQFLTKVILCAICINFSAFFCSQLLNLNALVSDSICELGKNLCGNEITFNSLIIKSNEFMKQTDSFNIISFNGILKGFISVGLLGLLFSYSIRFLLIKVFILCSPFAMLSLSLQTTSWIFKIWLRSFISLLLLQSFVSIILIILFTINITSDIFSQICYLSSLYILLKANSYIKEVLGGISTDFNLNISSLRSLLR